MRKIKIPNILQHKHAIYIGTVLLLIAVSLMFQWAGANKPSDTTPTDSIIADSITFYDDKRGTNFTIGLDPTSSEFGQFIFTVSDLGQYTGDASDSIKILKNDRKNINYRGTALFTPTQDDALDPVTTTVVLNGTIEPDGIKATITISENKPKRQFKLVVSPSTGNLGNVVGEHTSAVLEQDLSTMYELTSGAAIGDLSLEEFAQIINEQISFEGSIARIENLSEPQIESNPAGLIFFTIEQRVFFEKDGVESSQDVASVFLWEFDEWKFWFSEPL